MTPARFVHLRVHSPYSLSEGAMRLPALIRACREMAMPAVAVTDTNNLFGALEFADACRSAGIQPIIGCQLSIDCVGGADSSEPDRLLVLVQNEIGYRNLLDLLARAYLEGEAARDLVLGIDDLAAAAEGLLCLAGGPASPVGRLLADGQGPAAEAVLATLAQAFPGRLYVELMRHRLEVEDRIEGPLIDLAYRLDLPLVATNDVYFPDADMYEAHDALLCIAGGTYVDEAERRQVTPDHRFKSADEMRALFADLPEAVDNTLVIARRCAFMPEPRDPILPAFPLEKGADEAEELRLRARDGLAERLRAHVLDGGDGDETELARPYEERLEHEIEIILGMGYPGYFLIVADFIGWAREQGIPVGPGRGSGAGSVVAWALGITDLDPLRFGLLFERFLNPERVSMPDFDVDFCQERRDDVIRYVQQKYGRDRVAQIITFGKLQARAVLRDVGRVLRMPYGQVDRICKLVPYNPANPVTLAAAIEGEPQLQDMRRTDEDVARLIDVALKLEGLFRHASTHAAGVVIGDRPLKELIPLYRDPRSDMPVTQFDMKSVERAGLVKFDFLGLKTLSVIARATELLARRGVELDMSRIPFDDEAAYAMLAEGEASGVFQLESPGMRDVLRRLKPDRFEDLIAVVALYRPGPMANIDSYIDRKHGRETPDYMHPTLEPILKETHGIMIYQEQVMQIAQELSGFTLGHADLLRRAMGKKKKAEMAAQRAAFVDGATARGVPEASAINIFEQVDRFAGYGFNKSHAAAYALVAYQTAWLKANHPVEFIAALMSFDLNNTDKLSGFKQELARLGISLLPPDVDRSESNFTVEQDADGRPAVRYALSALRNVGRQAMKELVADRVANGPFTDLADFAGRLGGRVLNKRLVESLAAAGALDSLLPNRRTIHDNAERLVRYAAVAANDRESNQQNLFAAEAGPSNGDLRLAEVEDWPTMECLRHEFESVGFYLSAHPLESYGSALERLGVLSSADLEATVRPGEARRLKMAGTVIERSERFSRNGKRLGFVRFSDSAGSFEVMMFAEVLAASRDDLDSGAPLLLTVEGRHEDDRLRLTAQAVEPLEPAAAATAAGLKIYVAEPAALPNLASVIDRQGPGRGRVRLVLDVDDREIEVLLPDSYRITSATRGAIKSLAGVADVRDI